jgi:putative nucleotidyltransferase with HDIG domain
MGPSVSSAGLSTRQRYFAIDLASLRTDRLLNFDLYLDIDGEMILYREKSLSFTDDCRRRLLESKVTRIYIDERQRSQYLGYMESELPTLLRDENISAATKAGIMYVTSKAIVESIFDNPTFGQNIKRSEQLVEHTVRFLTAGPEAFRDLLTLSDEDYKLYSHSVNVCTFSLGLAQQIGVRDGKTLEALGIGAMLHDIGKTRIDARVMRKRTALSHEEYELMKRHVELGVQILRETNVIPEAAYIPVWLHQEREDGSGYPRGLHGSEIHLFGKIAAIADTFDAMTTHRVYRRGIPTFETLKLMLAMPFDQVLLREFISLLGPA